MLPENFGAYCGNVGWYKITLWHRFHMAQICISLKKVILTQTLDYN